LPIGTGNRWLNSNSRADKLIGGWQANAIVSLETGIPFDVTASTDSDTDGMIEYANLVGNPYAGTSTSPSQFAGTHPPGRFLNPAAFAQPGPGLFGDVRPYTFHGPGIKETNLSLFKNFPMGEARRLQLRADFFDAFNHPNFDYPAASVSDTGDFGESTSTSTNPRTIEFVGKFFF
jgi:hypothetical protein